MQISIIENMKTKHKKNKYSNILFNELVLFYLLNKSGYFFEYETSSFLKISNRTFERYIREINETYVLHRIGRGLESFNQNGHKSYHVNLDIYIKETDSFVNTPSPQTVLLPIGFCQKHPRGLDSVNQHIVRLTRCALLLHCVNNKIKELNEYNQKQSKDVIMECAKYYFVEMNFGASLKTFRRDMSLVIDVIDFMKDK